ALGEQADAILVHHGYVWQSEQARRRGMEEQRLQTLRRHDISLFAYHLPPDPHPQLGTNARLANVVGLEGEGAVEPGDPVSSGRPGRLPHGMSAEEFADYVESRLGRAVQHIGEREDEIETLAWCTGAAQGFIEQAQALGVDAYLSGEISEPTVHVARETGIHYFACGHHATERYGVQALGDWLAHEH